MRRALFFIGLTFCICPFILRAQDSLPTASEAALVTVQDVYGQPMLLAKGVVTNDTESAFADVTLNAVAFDAAGSEIGEGIGYIANACGAALLPDFVLTAGSEQAYVVPLDLYESDTVVDHVELTVQATPADVVQAAVPAPGQGVTRVDTGEVVQVEWIDEGRLRYAEGCRRDLFNQWTWRDYDLRTKASEVTVHPKVELIREPMLRQLGLLEPLYLAHSFLSFDPSGRRLVYQTELNTFLSAEPDGSFKRLMIERLSDRTLQGITWLGNGNFIAYYYGASGDLVTYFTGNADGRTISEVPADSTPSLITPGANATGERIVIGLEVDGKTGYYVKLAAYETTTLLFESPLPGNNWPGPLYERDADGKAYVYAAVPTDAGAVLMCYNLQTQATHQLTALPLQLASDERGWWWLSPDSNTIALAADGVNGGLWLIDLNATESCE